MEKILVLVNPQKPEQSTVDFACYMAKLTQSRLTGVFVENVFFEYIPVAGPSAPFMYGPPAGETTKEKEQVNMDMDQSIRWFRETCEKKEVECSIYRDKGEPIQETIFESRYADLIITDPGLNFYERDEGLPSHFVKQLLANAECPVLLSPEEFTDVDEIVFCYDGSASSVFSTKLFTYLLPEFKDKKVVLLEISRSGKEPFDEGHKRTMDWLRFHYSSVYYQTLRGEVHDELFTHFFMQRKKLIVLGAYGRSLLSNFFKKSNADILIRMVDLPLFITHH